MLHLCFIKCGNIATSTVVDLLLDETAARKDIEFTVVGSGPKMTPADTERIGKIASQLGSDMIVVCGPNAGAPGMMKLRQILKDLPQPKIVIGDGPSKKVRSKLEEEGFGYLIMEADPLIGARREFLDPTEMAVFNADVLKVLAAAGSLRVVQQELDAMIDSLGSAEPYMPRKVVTETASLAKAGFSNPYARAKAATAFELASAAGEINAKACFEEKEPQKYLRLVAQAHEAVRTAAKMVDEAREIEKASDTVLRTPHSSSGKVLKKRKLMEKPQGAKA